MGYNTAERGVEEVWIFADGLLEASYAVVCEDVKVYTVAVLLAKLIQSSELRDLDFVIIAARGVSVSTEFTLTEVKLTTGRDLHE